MSHENPTPLPVTRETSIDILLVSLGATAGLREGDAELVGSMRRAGATVEIVQAAGVREWRTYGLIEYAWARSARRAARDGIAQHRPRAILYSTSTAALLGPTPGAIRFDAPAAGNRPGRHGLWQRPVERVRFEQSPLLLPWSEGGLAEAPKVNTPSLVVPVAIDSSGPLNEARDITAITYGANPHKKGLDRVLAAWRAARRSDETLVVAGLSGEDEPGVRYAGMLSRDEYRQLLRRARLFVTAPRREDYGTAQLEALADGCQLVTTATPGPYEALPLARSLDSRLVGDDLASSIRTAVDDPLSDYKARAVDLMKPWRTAAVDRLVAERLVPLLLDR